MTAPHQRQLQLTLEPGAFAIARFAAGSTIPFDYRAGFFSITQTRDELSIVCQQELVPARVQAERERALLRVAGPLDFALTGILASLLTPLAEAGISVFVLSTFDTDYLLIRKTDLERAIAALESRGHTVQRSTTA
jgi:hypothetical protein